MRFGRPAEYASSYRKAFNPKGKNHVRHVDIPARLTAALASNALDGWQTKLLTSLDVFFKQNGCLTRNQYAQLQKAEQTVATAPARKAATAVVVASNPFHAQIVQLRTEKGLSSFETSFLASIQTQLERKGNLSQKQLDLVAKIASRFSADARKANDAWVASFTDEKRSIWNACVAFYKALNIKQHTGYYSSILDKVTDDNYTPSEADYVKLCNNKYSQNIAAAVSQPPVFEAGAVCKLRSNFGRTPLTSVYRRNSASLRPGALVTIIEVKPEVKGSSKGCRLYSVLPFGKSQLIEVEERNLKLAR